MPRPEVVNLTGASTYSRMMSDLCVFFEKYLIRETNRSLKIVFNFKETGQPEMEFDLEHFRQVLERYQSVKVVTRYYTLNQNQIWKLLSLFSDDMSVNANNRVVNAWIEGYSKGFFPAPDIEAPDTGNDLLNGQLERVMGIWQSFVSACRRISADSVEFRKLLRHSLANDIIEGDSGPSAPWTTRELYIINSDGWPERFLRCVFHKIEELELIQEPEKSKRQSELAAQIKSFLSKATYRDIEENSLIQELSDLLNLPVWKKRYELYAAWILTLIEKAFVGHKIIMHHQDGKLLFTFSATHLATIELNERQLNLWSEVRSPVSAPQGKSRFRNIQPDYTIYLTDLPSQDDCIAAIEVKQYKEPSRRTFAYALNDYAKGLQNANVFLVNYMRVPHTLELKFPERSFFIGHVRPLSDEVEIFVSSLRKALPEPPVFRIGNLGLKLSMFQFPIECLIIDISGSLDKPDYKEFLKRFLLVILECGSVRKIIMDP